MRLHTKLDATGINAALKRAQDRGLITADVHFTVESEHRSMTHPRAFELQLGSYRADSLPPGTVDQYGKNMRTRRVRNATRGEARYAATWHEWGWLIAEIFAADPEARWGSDPARSRYASGYFSPADFHAKSHGQFRLPVSTG